MSFTFAPTDREVSIVIDLGQLPLLTGDQLVQLHFESWTTPQSRGSACRRAIHRSSPPAW